MKYYELCDLNFLWENISRMVDELHDDKEVQIVLETWNDKKYWLINHNITENEIPVIVWCYENGEPEHEDIVCYSWQDLKERIFEIITDKNTCDNITNYYAESI